MAGLARSGGEPRPRDALGRPLPYGERGVAPYPTEAALPPDRALAEAQRLLDTGLLFQAHEVLEAVWKAAPDGERELWRGMTQVVVGVTHMARGNAVGAGALLRRGAGNLAPFTSQPHHGVDVAGLADWALGLAAELERPGGQPRGRPSTVPVPRLVPRAPER